MRTGTSAFPAADCALRRPSPCNPSCARSRASITLNQEIGEVEKSMSDFPETARTKLKRLPKRGVFDREIVNAILDEGFICHVGFAADDQPFVIPTGYARAGDKLFIHGSQASRMLRKLSEGIDVCVTVTLIDGLVLARSAFHHSINYRSVVIFGSARVVEDPDEKLNALHSFTEHIVQDRWKDVRPPDENELRA